MPGFLSFTERLALPEVRATMKRVIKLTGVILLAASIYIYISSWVLAAVPIFQQEHRRFQTGCVDRMSPMIVYNCDAGETGQCSIEDMHHTLIRTIQQLQVPELWSFLKRENMNVPFRFVLEPIFFVCWFGGLTTIHVIVHNQEVLLFLSWLSTSIMLAMWCTKGMLEAWRTLVRQLSRSTIEGVQSVNQDEDEIARDLAELPTLEISPDPKQKQTQPSFDILTPLHFLHAENAESFGIVDRGIADSHTPAEIPTTPTGMRCRVLPSRTPRKAPPPEQQQQQLMPTLERSID